MKKALHAKNFRLRLAQPAARHAKPAAHGQTLRRAASLALACACLFLSVSVYPASAASSMSSLQSRLDKLSQSIAQHRSELNSAKKKEAAAKALESELREQISVIQAQISLLSTQIAEVQNSIGESEQQIAAKEQQIVDKQAEIDQQWSDFKQHIVAMQELHDGGSVAMLSSVKDMYQLLTFNEVLQDISLRDTQVMNEMRDAKQELQDQKTELENKKTELEEQKADLDAQNAQMKSKQSELTNSITAAQLSAAEAQQAQQAAQAAIESDEMNYEAVKKEIQKLIAQASQSQTQLSFTGFACPLRSYSRISSEYGYRVNPVSGVYKLHAGIDFAAASGTPIYAAAGGYVQVAGWSTGGYGNYVIIYHGKMTDGNSYTTLYAHMSKIATTAGTYVAQGDLIGYVGTTGNSTGNHLHLEVWQGGSSANSVDPRKYIPIPHN